MLFTSLPLTIGLKYDLLRLTILLGMLSLLSLFRKWFFCWRYILVMISSSLFSLTVNRFSAFPLSLSISRISFSILPSRSRSLRVIFLVWLLLCLLFPVCQVRLLHVKELCTGTVDSQSAAQLTGSGCRRSAVPAVSNN